MQVCNQVFQSNVTLLMCVNLWPSVSLWYVSSSNQMHHCDVRHPYIRSFDCQWTHSSMTLQLIIRIYTIIVLKVYAEINSTYTINQTHSTIIVNDPDWKYTILRFGNYQKDSFLNYNQAETKRSSTKSIRCASRMRYILGKVTKSDNFLVWNFVMIV